MILKCFKGEVVMYTENDNNLNTDEILIILFLKKLGYEEKIINKVCEVIKLS